MLPIDRVIGHREWAPGRKGDPVYDMNWRRAGVAGIRPRATIAPAPREDDDTMQIDIVFGTAGGDGSFEPNPGGTSFRGSCTAEVGANSSVVEAAWVRWAAHYGPATWRIVFWDGRGPIGEIPPDVLIHSDNYPIPAACRSFTVEGTRAHPGVTVAATLLQRMKS